MMNVLETAVHFLLGKVAREVHDPAVQAEALGHMSNIAAAAGKAASKAAAEELEMELAEKLASMASGKVPEGGGEDVKK